MESINAKYVSQKISKTKWRPVSHSDLQLPEIFATGSWDNEVGMLTLFKKWTSRQTSLQNNGILSVLLFG